ncbi:MAG: ArnT family glycosyltransferase [Pyrinomonadaceae bacterium]
MQRSILAKRVCFLLFILIAGFYLWALGSLPLVGPDEPRYAQVAREMFARRDFITPTLGGYPWFEKPPLLYWMMMLSYRILGINEYAARFGPAICGLLTAAFVYWIGRTLTDHPDDSHEGTDKLAGGALGEWSALIWLSSLGAITFSRGASFDIVLTMIVTGAFAFFCASQIRDGTKGGPFRTSRSPIFLIIGFYFFAGLSLLAKGLIGFVIIFGVIGLYYLIRREWPKRAFAVSLVWGIPLALAVAGVWFVPMIARHGWTFIDQFIIQHHFARFVSNKYHHPGPIYFYLPVIVGLALPWTIILGAAIISIRRWSWRGASPLDRLRVFAFVWLILPMAFFSFSGSKLTAYILPVLPVAAILVGERIVCALKAGRGQTILRLTGGLLLLLAGLGYWYVNGRFKIDFYCLTFAAAPLLIVGATSLIHPRWRATLFILIALAVITSSGVTLKCIAPVMARTESVRDVLSAAAARGYGATPVVQMHTVERTAEFYAANRMSYGADGEPVKLEGVMQVVDAARRNNGLVLCFVPLQYQSQLTTYAGLKSEVIADNGRVALVAVRLK